MHGSIPTRMYRQLVVLAAALILTGGVVGLAAAAEPSATKSKAAKKTPPPDPGYDRAAAKQAYEEALRAFNLGQWGEAVAGFQRSYKLSGDAALLFNVAQAQRQAGNVKEAIIAYKAFLREKPDTPHREMIEAKLKELEAWVETKTAAAKPADSKPQPDRLTGVMEDPFDEKGAPPAAPPLVPPVATTTTPALTLPPVATVPPAAPVSTPTTAVPTPGEPTTPQAVPEAAASGAASAVAPAPPVGLEPTPIRENVLDLSQQLATPQPAAASSSRWWLWTGIGAVVAAGGVTAVILSTRGPERDTSCPSGINTCIPVGK